MKTFGSFRTGLCIYEFLRLSFLVKAFLLLEPAGRVSFPWLALITPGAMFLLIALFWRINISHYGIYAPLYMAGKGLSIITTLFWLFFAKSYMIRELFFDNTASVIIPGIVLFMLLGDILSTWLVSKIVKSQ
jgi:hypothetical protein